jgi:chemotaxis receptor (MCP) glutamine deamidase CheD
MMISGPPNEYEDRKAPETFDELAAEIDYKFQKVEAEVMEMHEELREAGANSEALRRRLLGGASGQ